MNFAEAMKEMMDGKSVRASSWVAEAYISTDHLIPVTLYSLGELLALNWEIYEEPKPEPKISGNDKLKYRMFAEVLQTIAKQFEEMSQ